MPVVRRARDTCRPRARALHVPRAAPPAMSPPPAYLAAFLSLSFLLDAAVGAFLVASSISVVAITPPSPSAKAFPVYALSTILIIAGVALFTTSLFRLPIIEKFAKCLHRFAGKSFLCVSSAAVVLALEPEAAGPMSWRAVCAIMIFVLGCAYAAVSLSTCGSATHPRPLIWCGELTSPAAASARPSPFAAPPDVPPPYMLAIPASAARPSAPPPRSKYDANPFAAATASTS